GRRRLDPIPHSVCVYFMGMGMRAVIRGQEILVGNHKLAETFGVSDPGQDVRIDELRDQGLTVLQAYRDAEPLGLLALATRARPEALAVIDRLRRSGIERFMLVTGDEYGSTKALARELGIAEVHASILPEDKARIVDEAMAQGRKVLMVGDGVNDALALSRADVGVAVGTSGSEAAVEAADIALAREGLGALADVHELSRTTLRVVRQNFWIATGSNIAGVALAGLGLLSPVMAGFVHIGHSLGVLANSSRLLAFPFTPPAGGDNNGEAHGLRNPGPAAAASEREAPRPGQDSADLQPGHHQGQRREAPRQRPVGPA
ncbi:MAG: HAD-IC family P-type ATPase, partial [Desulfovibrionaceae bacterium]